MPLDSTLIPLTIDQLSKKYVKGSGESFALKDVSFQLQPGEAFGLLGPNGAGKTSLISCVTTLEEPTSGRVLIFGQDNQVHPLQTKKKIGIVHQEVINSGFFSVEEIVKFQRGYYNLSPNSEVITLTLKRLSLWEHRHKKVKQLSGGMKRRLMIAKALVTEPQLLLLDEPTAGVDIELRENLYQLVRDLKKSGMTVLLTTHYLEEAEMLCDRVGILHKGQLLTEGPTLQVIEKFSDRKAILKFRKDPVIQQWPAHRLQGSDYIFSLSKDKTLGDLLTDLKIRTEDILDIQIQNGNLEEAFLKVLRGPS